MLPATAVASALAFGYQVVRPSVRVSVQVYACHSCEYDISTP